MVALDVAVDGRTLDVAEGVPDDRQSQRAHPVSDAVELVEARGGEPAHDCDPDDIVETAGQRDAGHGSRSRRSCKRVRARPVVGGEHAPPAESLERVSGQEERRGGDDQPRVRARKRPSVDDEVAYGECHDDRHDGAERNVETEPDPAGSPNGECGRGEAL